MISVGVDVGGTFTDILLVDTDARAFRTVKVPTTIDDRSRAFIEGLSTLDTDFARFDWLVHGTTVGTNAVLENKGAKVGLITTLGFRDVLELGRRTRPRPYGLSGNFLPLVERCHRYEVDERMDAQGRVIRPLDGAGLKAAVEALIEDGVDALVIHFLHSYANPEHEAEAVRIARELWPNEYAIAGHELIREAREFERGSTAAIHATIGPVLGRYIGDVARRLSEAGFRHELLVMQTNGGMMGASVVDRQAVQTVMSGPAAGVLAAAEIVREAGFTNAVTGDMGGTSFDVALVVDGQPVLTPEKEIRYGVPIRVPMIDIHTIGAGGGSIARVDDAGMLRIGPESAGSWPGPIGFGRGGDRVTITDANFVLGRLNPTAITGSDGAAPLDTIRERVAADLAKPLGLDIDESCSAVIDVAIAELAGAIRLISIEKGHDPRDFVYVPFGGAGPLHAVALARELGITRILSPRFPGLTSALGCVLADLRHDFVQTVNSPLAELTDERIEALMSDHIAEGQALIEREGVPVKRIVATHSADLMFKGQSHVLHIAIENGFDPHSIRQEFLSAYKTRFNLSLEDMIVVLVAIRTSVVGERDKVSLKDLSVGAASGSGRPYANREVWFNGAWHRTEIYRRDDLPEGARFNGPAIVEQVDTTLVVDPGATATVDGLGNIVIDVGSA